MNDLIVYSPAGVVPAAADLRRSLQRLRGWGFDARLDDAALARRQRFAGDDDVRLAAIHRVAAAAPSVALASRGGYGLTRLLDRIDWKRIARSVARGTRWVGYSDITALQLALLAHTGAGSWAGPCAVTFGRDEATGGVDETTRDVFLEAMGGELQALGWRTEAGFDGVGVRGPLWGGNLAMLCSLLGTPHLPAVAHAGGGILFLEDVGEHPYRIERMLLQLQQAGVLARQKAVLLGSFTEYKPSPLDRGFTLKTVVQGLRERIKAPVLTGLPFGHGRTKVCLPVGCTVNLVVERRDALLAWEHDHG